MNRSLEISGGTYQRENSENSQLESRSRGHSLESAGWCTRRSSCTCFLNCLHKHIISMLFPVGVDGYCYLWFGFCVERSESGICSSPVGTEVWTTTVSKSGPRFGPCMKGNESCRMFSSISNSDSLRTVFSDRSLAVETNKSRVLMHSSGTTI